MMFKYLIIFTIFINTVQIYSLDGVYGIASIENNSGEENPLRIETFYKGRRCIFVPIIIKPYDIRYKEEKRWLPMEYFLCPFPCSLCCKKPKGPGQSIDGVLEWPFVLDDSFANLNVWYQEKLEEL